MLTRLNRYYKLLHLLIRTLRRGDDLRHAILSSGMLKIDALSLAASATAALRIWKTAGLA